MKQVLLPQKLQVAIKQEDIDNGIYDNPELNACALALKRSIKIFTKEIPYSVICGIVLWKLVFKTPEWQEFTYQPVGDTQQGFAWRYYCMKGKIAPESVLIQFAKTNP